MGTTFKPATLDDVAQLLAMRREFCAHEGMSFEETDARRVLEALIADETYGRAFLICVDEEVLGYAVLTFGYSLEFHGRDAFVDELFLRAQWRGQGIGQRALAFLAGVCAAKGIKALHLEVARTNTAAQQTYRKFGFTDRGNYLLTKWLAAE